MTFVHIGVFLIALAFAIFAIYLCVVLSRIAGLLTTVGYSTKQLESKTGGTIKQLELAMVEAKSSATDVQLKLNALESVTDTVTNVGKTADLAAQSVQNLTASYTKQADLPGTKPFISAIQFGEMASSLVDTWKKAEKVTK